MSELPGLDRRDVDGHPLLLPILTPTLTRCDITGERAGYEHGKHDQKHHARA
jgi:hypothetical protein